MANSNTNRWRQALPALCWIVGVSLATWLFYKGLYHYLDGLEDPKQLVQHRRLLAPSLTLIGVIACSIPLHVLLKVLSVRGRLPRFVKWGLPVTRFLAMAVISLPIVIFGGISLMLLNLPGARHGSVDLMPGNMVIPTERTRSLKDREAYLDWVMAGMSEKELKANEFTRFLIADHIEEANRQMMESKPGQVGSNRNYDFVLPCLTVLLHHFGDKSEVLYPETRRYLIDVLLTEKGGEPFRWTPGIYGLPLEDTENHILNAECSRFLTNQWLAQHGSTDPRYDNRRNGLEKHLLAYLQRIERAGFFEYNSNPYMSFSIRAMMALEAFATDPVASSARRILDRMNWQYALGSLSFRCMPPFRRQPKKAGWTHLQGAHHTPHIQAFVSRLEGEEGIPPNGSSLWAAMTSYQIPDAIAAWAKAKPAEYFVRIGHGSDGSPEIYSGGPGWLITAGGVSNDFLADAVARPTTLMLEDGAMSLSELLYVTGPGDDVAKDFRKWNNTGVHRRFAVGAGPVHVPEGWQPTSKDGAWSLYERAGQIIGVYSTDTLGLFCLLSKGDVETHLRQLIAANPDASQLKQRFVWPGGGTLDYDVHAEKDQWVIISEDGKPVDRDHGAWPLMAGEVPGFNRGCDQTPRG